MGDFMSHLTFSHQQLDLYIAPIYEKASSVEPIGPLRYWIWFLSKWGILFSSSHVDFFLCHLTLSHQQLGLYIDPIKKKFSNVEAINQWNFLFGFCVNERFHFFLGTWIFLLCCWTFSHQWLEDYMLIQ
jgi:hypothetical protein